MLEDRSDQQRRDIKSVDLEDLIGKSVRVRLYRKKRFREFHGTLTSIGNYEICLVDNTGIRWIHRPSRFRDFIEEEV